MSVQDLATTKPLTPTRTTKRERNGVTGRVKTAVDLMVFEGKTWDQAADDVGLHRRSMRLALERPATLAYLRTQKQVFREAASAKNIQRLVEIRDQDDNKTAAVQAIKVLEQVPDDEQRSSAARSPGVVIVIGDRRGPVTIDGVAHADNPAAGGDA